MNLIIEQKNSSLEITLNRPEAHNALDAELIAGLTKVFSSIDKRKEISVVYLKADGPSFCAGGDLNWMRKSLKFSTAQNIKDTQKLSDMYEAIFQCPVPVIGRVHGNVMGGGVGLTAVCDIVAAENATKFCLSEVRLGLVPSIIAPYVLRKTQESSIKPLMLTAEVFGAEVARQLGLSHFVGSLLECDNFVKHKLSQIVPNGPEAVRITKGLVQKIKSSNWSAARALTVKTIAARRKSAEGQEGMNAFFEKRQPSWRRS